MGNVNVKSLKKQASKAKKLNDKRIKQAVLSVVAHQSLKTRGKRACLRTISYILDHQGVRTAQSLFYTPKRLSQFKKRNSMAWKVAETRYQHRMHRTKQIILFTQIEIEKKRKSKRRRVLLDALS